MSFVAGLLMGATSGLAIYSTVEAKVLPFAIIAVIALVGFHAAGINRRLDALMQLLDKDSGNTAGEERQDDQNAGQQTAPPNGGPATPGGNSGVTERPPSAT